MHCTHLRGGHSCLESADICTRAGQIENYKVVCVLDSFGTLFAGYCTREGCLVRQNNQIHAIRERVSMNSPPTELRPLKAPCPPPTHSFRSNAVVESRLPALQDFERRLQRLVTRVGLGQHDSSAIQRVVHEALLNAAVHGNKMKPSKQIHVVFSVDRAAFSIRIQDEGEGFDPDTPAEVNDEAPSRPRGRGLTIMRQLTDHMQFNPEGNAVSLFRRCGKASL